MTRRDVCYKWWIYALGLFPIWVLDCCVLPSYPILGATPMLLPLAVAAVATFEGQTAGGGFGIAVGFLWATTYPGSFWYMILLLMFLGYVAGAWVEQVFRRGFLGYFLSALGTLGVIEGVFMLLALSTGKVNSFYLIPLVGKQILWSIACSPWVYWIFYRVFSKVGGTKLA